DRKRLGDHDIAHEGVNLVERECDGDPCNVWGKFCGCHNYGTGLIDVWLLTGDRSYRDAGVEYGYEHARTAKVWGGFGHRGWGRKMASVLATYKVTRDPKLKAWLIENCRPPVPDKALREDGRCLIMGRGPGSWQAGLCGHAIWHNWVLHRDEYKGVARDDYRDQIVGIARNVARYWWSDELHGGPYYITFPPIKPGDKAATAPTFGGGGGDYTQTCVDMMTRGYLLTGDPALLKSAKKFWNAANGEEKTVQRARLQTIRGMGSNTFWCRRLVSLLAHPRADRSPPKKITDLKAEATGGGAVKLSWTAPSDDDRVAAYQVKHAPRPIVAFDDYRAWRDYRKKWTWWSGYNVAGEPPPGRPGGAESMTVTDLPAGTYHFAIRSRDAAPNESPISNVVKVDVR
ncbi:MAG: fibronectin type III domain-containing protein, partial [Planctomycetota bacterium]